MSRTTPLPRVDLHLTGDQLTIEEMVAFARAAEDGGLGAVWVAEAFRDAFVPLAAIAANTRRIEIGSNVAQWTRSLPNIELTAGDLAELSGDRFVLGLGSTTRAWNENWHGISFDRPLRRMREYVEAIRVLWRAGVQDPVSYYGEIFQVREYLRFNGPMDRPIPIALGASRAAMSRLAGEIADRIHFNACLSPSYLTAALIPEMVKGRERAGRPEDAVKVGILTITAVHEDHATAVRLARHQLAFYVGVAEYFADLWAHHGLSAEHDSIQALFRSGDVLGAIEAVPEEAVSAMCLVGEPAAVRAGLADYAGTADYLMLYSPSFALTRDEIVANHAAILGAFAPR